MKYSIGLFLVVCSVTISVGSSLQCYKCSDYYGGRCEKVQECSYEDSCLTLHEKGGKTIRQCIRYTDCDNSRLSQMFPAVSGFTYSSVKRSGGESHSSLLTVGSGPLSSLQNPAALRQSPPA
ncbi:hypothetical protein AOLI_G00177620 [Acnodon oligacanthus]